MAIKYKDFEKREQLRKDYIDKAAEAAKTQANAYTDEQIKNIPAPPAPDIPTALPQKYEAFKVQLVQGNISEGEDPMWSEYHKPLWNGSQVLTNSSATTKAHFVTDTVLYWRSPRKYNLLITINGTEKEFVFEGEHNQYGTNWVIWQLKENDVVVAEAECIGAGNGQYYNNTSTVFVYCPDGSPYIGQTMTAARYGKKQYVYSLMNPAAILQYPSETENTRFLTMCQSIATKNAKLKLTLTDNVIEANYGNISNELVTTDYVNGDVRARWIGIVADRKPLAVGTYTYEDMKTCIKGVLEVEYTDEEATKECVYDKIQGESYTFKIGDFNHDESSAFDYYFNGAILIPFDTAQIQANFTYRPVSGTEKSIQVKSLVNNGQMLPYFDISELFGQASNTVMATITSNTAIENVDMGGRPITTISLTSNVQNFTDANDEIMVGSILTLTPSSLPQTYKKKAVTLATSGWVQGDVIDWSAGKYYSEDIDNKRYWYINYNANSGDTVYFLTSSGEWRDFYLHPSSSSTSDWLKIGTTPTPSSISTVGIEWKPTNEEGKRLYFYASNATFTYIFTTIRVTNPNNIKNVYPLTDADVKVNSEIRLVLDEANGKIAGQFGLKKTIDKEAGKLTFTADTLPTSAITGTLEIGDTSTEGAAFVEGITSDSTGFVKATEENTFTKTQTFNGTESQAGVKTNAIDNENGNRVVYFNGTKQMFGSEAIPSQVRSSAQRLYFERPVSGGTGTEIVEIANLSDVSSGGGTAGKVFTFTKDDILMFGHEVSFPMGTDKNYSNGSRTVYNLNSANRLGMLQFEVGKKYKLQWRTYGEGSDWTTVYAIASSITLSDGTTTAKAEFTVNGKTLVVVDRATATSNITSTSDLVYGSDGAVAYFSDFSTVEENVGIKVFTVPKQYIVRIPYDEVILPTSIVAIYGDNIAPATVEHKSSYIELNYGISSSVYYNDVFVDPTNYNHSQYLIGTKYYLEVVGGSTTGGAYFVGRRENVFDKHAVIKVADWTSETEGTFKWTDASIKPTGLLSGEIVNVGLVWNSDVELEFDTETDKETFEAAGCKIVKGKFLATALTITCTTKPTKPICFTYTVRNNAR